MVRGDEIVCYESNEGEEERSMRRGFLKRTPGFSSGVCKHILNRAVAKVNHAVATPVWVWLVVLFCNGPDSGVL